MPVVQGKSGTHYCVIRKDYIEYMPRKPGAKKYLSIFELPEEDKPIVQDHLKRTITLKDGQIVVVSPIHIEYWGFGKPTETFISADDIPEEHRIIVKSKLNELGYSD